MPATTALPPLPDFDLPPLPDITDPEFEKLAFTHSSLSAKRVKLTEFAEEAVRDNEKLEHLGDSLLNACVTLTLHKLFPNLQEGGATRLKSHLVANSTLAQLSDRYKLPSRLRADPSSLFNLRSGETTKANLFEAYLAAFYFGHENSGNDAFKLVREFIESLYTPIAKWALEELRASTVSMVGEGEEADIDRLAVGASARLNEYFTKNYNNIPTYDAQRVGEQAWKIVATAKQADGTVFTAEAIRSNKKAASTVAAYKICIEAGLI